jgi:4-diphosphocytidyl-2-C-methyl-D-erythritol kinase
MLLQQHADAVVVQAPAKINLFLEVLHKRPDNYHEIVTCMVAVDLFDTLTFTEDSSPDIRFTCNEPALPTGPDNLVWRAAELLLRHTSVQRGVRIELTKRIPWAAGLAGGSTDAAATLLGLNRLWNLERSREELAELSASLGSDIPFFFSLPAAWCTGRGETVTPVTAWPSLNLVLAYPGVGLSTARVFQRAAPSETPRPAQPMRDALESGRVEAIAAELFNRLQTPAEHLCPEVRALIQVLAGLKPVGHMMSGSGSSCFALCQSSEEAEKLATAVRAQLPRAQVFVVRTLTEGVLT